MSSPTEGESQDISPRGSTGISSTGPSTKGAVTPKARSSTMVPALPLTKEEAKVRVETVVVGREAKQARRDKLSKEEARDLSRGPRKGRSQQIRNVARSVSEEAVRGGLGEGGEEPTTSQLAIIPEHCYVGQELETNPASLLELTVKPTISKNLVFIKGPCPPRPRLARCDG